MKPATTAMHFPALDGLRAIAIMSVLLHHFVPPLFLGGTPLRNAAQFALALGGLGVDLFFALSGFLITGILIDAKSLPAGSFFGRFYKRRSLRIFPAYFTFLLPLLFIPYLFQNLSRWWFVLYLRNWLGPDRFSDGTLGHLWSLAVEEQFYILWAPLVFLCPKRILPWLIIGFSLAALPFRWWMLYLNNFSYYEVIRFTASRMDGLLLGGLVAVAWRFWDWQLVKRWSKVIALGALVGFVGNLDLGERLQWVAFSSWTAIFFAAVVAMCLELSPSSLAGRVLGSRFLAHLAKYSYAMYLWHLLVQKGIGRIFHMVLGRFSPALDWVTTIVYIAVLLFSVYIFGVISWKLIEAPFLRLKNRLPAVAKT